MKIALKRDGFSFKPADEATEEAFRKVKNGEVILATYTRHRNVLHHRKLFALLRIASENSDKYNGDPISLLDDIKVVTGRCDAKLAPTHHKKWNRLLRRLKPVLEGVGLSMPTLLMVVKPHSISFEKMDQSEFEPFYEDAVQFVVREVLPGVNREDLELEVLSSF